MAYDIATPYTHLVLQRVQFERDHGQQFSDSTYRPLRIISGYNPRVFIADMPEFEGDSADPNPTTVAVGERE